MALIFKQFTRLNSVNEVNGVTYVNLFLFALCSLLVFVGCASVSQKETVLANVNGEPITEEDLRYSLNVAHRREDLSSAGALNLSQYVQKLVDDSLLAGEARSAGMDKYPEVQQAIEAYILRGSVVRLHGEEIVQKVSITEEEIKDYYKKNYEKLTLGLIESKSEEEAGEILDQLKKGGSFKDLAKKYSTHYSKDTGGEIVIRRNSLPKSFGEPVLSLQPERISDVMRLADRYYVVKLIRRENASDDEFNNVKGRVEKDFRKEKEKDRSDEYLKYLREKSAIKIDGDLLSAIRLDGNSEETDKWTKDTRPLAEVDGSVLTVGDFVTMTKSSLTTPGEDILNSWIDRKIVDREALKRHYGLRPDLKKMIYRYENYLLKNAFIKKVILPQVSVTEKALQDYYSQHPKNFLKPIRYKIQQIGVKSMDEAEEIVNSLKNGADFSWLAKRKPAYSALKGGDDGWFTKAQLPKSVSEIIDTLSAGEMSPIIRVDSLYGIIRVQGKSREEVEAFDSVKNAVFQAYVSEQVNTLTEKYVAHLRAGARIEIYEKAVRAVEEKFRQ